MNRPLLLAALGVVVVAVAIGLNVLLWEEEVDESSTAEQTTASATPETPGQPEAQPQAQPQAQSQAQPETQPGAQSTSEPQPVTVPATKKESPGPVPPTFDVVRVNPKGDAVMAGRAEPGNTVIVMDADKVLGVVTADDRGEWVFVPEKPLPPGDRQLSLESPVEGEKPVASEEVVVLVVPEKGKDIGGRTTSEPSQPLALKVPRTGIGATVVLQKPTAGSLPSPPATAATAAPQPIVVPRASLAA